jgi:hypothetical protein
MQRYSTFDTIHVFVELFLIFSKMNIIEYMMQIIIMYFSLFHFN